MFAILYAPWNVSVHSGSTGDGVAVVYVVEVVPEMRPKAIWTGVALLTVPSK